MLVTFSNAHPGEPVTVRLPTFVDEPISHSGRVVTAPAMNAHNTFDEPNRVRRQAFAGFQIDGGEILVELPPNPVVGLRVARGD